MTIRNYKEGQNRHLALLFPPSLDEYVSEGNPVRAIDAYEAHFLIFSCDEVLTTKLRVSSCGVIFQA